jgi:hypothetical protein
MVEAACQGLRVKPDLFLAELESSDDLGDIDSGAISVNSLRKVAMTLATMWYQEK